MVTTVTEIAPDIFRISTYVPPADLSFNQFLIRDEQPLLYHTGMQRMFPRLREAVATVIDPSSLRWISFSHFEVDECGALNEWLDVAPSAQAVCSLTGVRVNIGDFASRKPRSLDKDEVLVTGKYRFRFYATPHLPHGWDSGMLFEEVSQTLFCSDLFHQNGDLEPVTEANIIDRARQTLISFQAGPLPDYMPYTPNTERLLTELAGLKPKTLAIMHGSTYRGDGEKALLELAVVMREVLGRKD